jgi:hypothetical protein
VTTAAERLLEDMRRSKQGWGPDDLHTLYLGFGFWCREGAKHRVYIHGEYPQLRATVARHSPLPIGYVQRALSLIDQAAQLKSREEMPGRQS